ncbi:DNA topoisomerase IB [Roseobacter sp. CCS2]|uniref:DNA topoisomerase IB n=1 Tax=Roseobacter sp. CCS2 TaxID=391593 RepID=UPI0000F3F166|nr:DNA topoisomerase IB [Roseobacter sp. CCS2]EBA11142.1 putative DNA topoisomerase I protein [Roseobacter sp. CCS2]
MTKGQLVYFPDTEPGIGRRRRGKGFSYVDPQGAIITDKAERQRLASLAVPPAYEAVWMCPTPLGHLQATGRDVKGRKQYLYHPDWTAQQAQAKYDALPDFGRALPRLRRHVQDDLNEEAGEREFALAAAVTLIDRTALRVGNPQYTDENGSYGALTLRNRHIQMTGNRINLQYRAKGGQRVRRRLSDAKLARVLGKINDLPGATLLSWIDDDGTAQMLNSEALNAYIADAAGTEDVTAKTFRTWAGSCAAYEVASQGGATIKDIATAASTVLHNTPTIARNSYIHPAIIDLAGKDMIDVQPATLTGLRVSEQRLLGFLDTQ